MKRGAVVIGIALAILVATGVVHGLWTNRWAAGPEHDVSGEQLTSLPRKLGEWNGEWAEVDPAQYPRGTYGVGALGRFTHEADGSLVTVYFAVGRPGPLAVHNPELCYGGGGLRPSGVAGEGELTFGTPPRAARYNYATFSKADAPVPQHARVLWTWGAAGEWQAHSSPRTALAKHRRIYKLYLVRPVQSPDEPQGANPALGLLGLLLPEIEKALGPP